jgi:hypothetical protein
MHIVTHKNWGMTAVHAGHTRFFQADDPDGWNGRKPEREEVE